jgi:copper chaperone
MISLIVHDMSCGHCVSAITRAIQSQDPGAEVQVDLSEKRVEIVSSQLDLPQALRLIQEAGYTPQPG